ncbi:MAG TPA: hypothetical protein IAA20_07460 [Candidatus Enterococcus avicola]|uniref:Uncharacterized protein n=1 Tax=Candidatus Enterococcus avicola TaxID=2838561 RepID=A0A9D2JJG2_9ENTE|nr:hypothetical protein [Candidatus Enterococcus avicola]
MELKEIIELKTVQAQEQSIFYSGILQSLMDESSSVKKSNGVTLYLPIEKLNYIIEELEELRKNIKTIDSLIVVENEFI